MIFGEMDNKANNVQAILDYTFRDCHILWEALNLPGSGITYAGERRFRDGNKRLALLGDTVLKTALIYGWFGTSQPRGKRSCIVSTQLEQRTDRRCVPSHPFQLMAKTSSPPSLPIRIWQQLA